MPSTTFLIPNSFLYKDPPDMPGYSLENIQDIFRTIILHNTLWIPRTISMDAL